jgi:hypothetical protein
LALGADRQNHRFGTYCAAALQQQRKITHLALYSRDIGTQPDIGSGDLAVPEIEDGLALARVEPEVRAQHQLAGRRHHMLALLVLEDGVAEVVRLFEEDVRHVEGRGMRSGT